MDLIFPGTFTGSEGGTNTYTSADLDSAVQAFTELRGVFTPKAKLGHAKQQALLQADGYPSAGDITRVYRRGERLVVDVDQVPAKVAALIKAGGYGPRSAEFLLNAEFGGKTYPLVLKGFAWLGEDAPAVAGLDDILALYSRDAAPQAALTAAGTLTVTLTEEPPNVRTTQVAHTRNPFVALARLVGLAGADPGEITDAELAQQAIALVNQLVAREAQEQLDGDDEGDDIRDLLMARDILQRFAQGELLEGGDADDAGAAVAYSAGGDEEGVRLLAALTAVKTHLDGIGKGRKGVGMARVAHRLLTGYAQALLGQWQDPDTEGNTSADEGPEGERGDERRGGVPVAHTRPPEEETVNDSELRGLLGLDPEADIKQALLALKGRSVDLSDHESVKARVVELERQQAHAAAAARVEAAIDAHKLAPKQREWAIGRALADPADFAVFLSLQPEVWRSSASGSAGDSDDAPQPPTEAAVKLARDLGLSVSDLTPTETFEARLAAAKQAAIAATHTTRRG